MIGVASEYTLRQILKHLNGIGIWQLDNITPIAKWYEAVDELYTFYTVPSGYIFYLCHIHFHITNDAATREIAFLDFYDATTGFHPYYYFHVLPDSQREVSMSFPVPLEFNAGSTFAVRSSNIDLLANVCIVGFTIPT